MLQTRNQPFAALALFTLAACQAVPDVNQQRLISIGIRSLTPIAGVNKDGQRVITAIEIVPEKGNQHLFLSFTGIAGESPHTFNVNAGTYSFDVPANQEGNKFVIHLDSQAPKVAVPLLGRTVLWIQVNALDYPLAVLEDARLPGQFLISPPTMSTQINL